MSSQDINVVIIMAILCEKIDINIFELQHYLALIIVIAANLAKKNVPLIRGSNFKTDMRLWMVYVSLLLYNESTNISHK